MLILAIMAVGILIGYTILPKKLYRINTWIQLCCIAVLVFCMGITLGRRENFWQEIGELGIWSLLLALIPMAGSAVLVWGMTRFWDRRKNRKERK